MNTKVRNIYKPSKFDIDVKSSLKSRKYSNGIMHVLLIVESCGFSYMLHIQAYKQATTQNVSSFTLVFQLITCKCIGCTFQQHLHTHIRLKSDA